MPKNEELDKELENNEIEQEKISNDVSEGKEEILNSEIKDEKTSEKKEVNSLEMKETKKEENKVDEATVIEKIKNFIAKIVAMQEENQKESADKKEEKDEKVKNETKKELKKAPEYMLEYYDLPYRYNETIVKVLAQTPKKLFVYWDISDNDRTKYINAFGEDFFHKTYPILLLYNEDKQYVKEIPINDFANSWYIDIQDPKTKYIIQLGRKFKEQPRIINMAKFEEENIILRTDYLPFADSNIMEAPNDHVLLENLPRYITFRNVKTNEQFVKDIGDLKNIFGNNYDVEEFYKNQYKDELTDGIFDMANPSSKLSSSSFK